jgi:hypothetical protein
MFNCSIDVPLKPRNVTYAEGGARFPDFSAPPPALVPLVSPASRRVPSKTLPGCGSLAFGVGGDGDLLVFLDMADLLEMGNADQQENVPICQMTHAKPCDDLCP